MDGVALKVVDEGGRGGCERGSRSAGWKGGNVQKDDRA